MTHRTIGTCSECGGRVSQPRLHYGVTPPIPGCESCGARMAQPHGPVVPMERPTKSSNAIREWVKKNAPRCDKPGASPSNPMFGPCQSAPSPAFRRDHWRQWADKAIGAKA